MKRTDVLIVGAGGVGGAFSTILAREPSVSKIVVSDVREDHGKKLVNTCAAGAYMLGHFPDIEFRKIDLLNKAEKVAEALTEINPRVIMSCTTMLTPWLGMLLPTNVLMPIYEVAGLGPYVSLHLRLVYRLMQAIKIANLDSFVVNASYADVVSYALGKVGLAPTVGGGNLDIIVTLARKAIGEKMNLKPRDVKMYLVTHHFNNRWFSGGLQGVPHGGPAPYFCKIIANDVDITDSYSKKELLELLKSTESKMRLDGHELDTLIASSFIKHVLALLHDERIFTHSPGPGGLPGGYPIRLGWSGATLELPDGITKQKAIEINLEGQRRDGIQEIRDDGTIVFTEEAYRAVKEVYNFDCKSFKISEVDRISEELLKKINEKITKHKQLKK